MKDKQRLAFFFCAIGISLVLGIAYTSIRREPEPIHSAQYPIRHIIIIDKENRSFDEMFGLFPGADGTSSAHLSSGRVVLLGHTPERMMLDISHSGASAMQAVDRGKMDRFDSLPGAWQGGKNVAVTQLHEADIPDYWRYARNFALDDRFFSTIMGPSFPNHLITVAATSGNTIDNPHGQIARAWGCDGGPHSFVDGISPSGKYFVTRPCFDFRTMPDLFQHYHLSWKYYAPRQFTFGYVWNALDAIKHIRYFVTLEHQREQ
jgi:phospholipase C